jgi:GT2 family glycosyltransferase
MGKAAGRVKPGQGKVVVGYLHPDEVSVSFHHSLIGLLLWDLQHNGRVLGGGGHVASHCGTGRLPDGRNEITRRWLDDHDAEWLWMVDTDMGFAPDTVDRLIAAADKKERPVVGGLCFGQRIVAHDPLMHTPQYRQFPTIYSWDERDGKVGFVPAETFPVDAVVPAAATGAACLLIHRSAAEAIRARHGDTWWTPAQVQGEWFSEDMSFCIRLASVDMALHVHTGVQTSHHKPAFLTLDSYRPPVHLPTVAAIPTKCRFDLLEPLVMQILEELPADRVLILDDGLTDGQRAQLAELGVAIQPAGEGIHGSWNRALDWAQQFGPCHVALLNDDVVLGAGVFSMMERAFSGMPDLWLASPNYDGRAGSGVQVVETICANRYDGSGGVAGFAMWLSASFAAAYRFPTDMMWWFGDNDAVNTVVASGGRCGVVLDASVTHVDGGSQTGTWADMSDVLELDRKAYDAKWGEDARCSV